MYQLDAAHIKAGRAYLGWSQEDLAEKTGLSSNTVRNLELGFISPRGKTVRVIRQAMEKAGIEFLEPAGIRPRMDDIKVYDNCEQWLTDMLQTAKKADNEIVVLAKSKTMLAKCLGASCSQDLDCFQNLDVRCLLFETAEPSFSMAPFRFRMAPKNISPASYIVYGNKHALIMHGSGTCIRFAVFTLPEQAYAYRSHFHAIWEYAEPLSGAKARARRKSN